MESFIETESKYSQDINKQLQYLEIYREDNCNTSIDKCVDYFPKELSPNQYLNSPGVNYLDLQNFLSKNNDDKLRTSITSQLLQKYPISHIEWFHMNPLRLTTQTVVIELGNIQFNDFRVDMQKIMSCLNQLREQQLIPKNLVQMKSKRFQINFGDGMDYQHSYISKTKEMNSSINFIFQSLQTATKQYKLRLFRNGMLQIPGVLELYQLSEIKIIVQQLIEFYKLVFESPHQISILYCYAVMTNYVSSLNIKPNERFNFLQMVKDVQNEKQQTLLDIQKQTGVTCTHFDVSKRRVVLYIKLVVDKQRLQFSKYNPLSTSNRKVFSSVTLLVTQRGIVLVQGCPEEFSKTYKVLKAFEIIVQQLFKEYIVVPPTL